MKSRLCLVMVAAAALTLAGCGGASHEVEPDLAVKSKEFKESFAAVAGHVIERCG